MIFATSPHFKKGSCFSRNTRIASLKMSREEDHREEARLNYSSSGVTFHSKGFPLPFPLQGLNFERDLQ